MSRSITAPKSRFKKPIMLLNSPRVKPKVLVNMTQIPIHESLVMVLLGGPYSILFMFLFPR